MKNYKKFIALVMVLAATIIFGACTDQSSVSEVQKPAQKVDQMISYEENHLLTNNDGREVPFVFTEPVGKTNYPLVVMYHGFGGSKDEGSGFIRIARKLAEQGIATIRMDFPGCGESQASFMEFSLKNNISDGNACLEYISKEKPINHEQIGLLGYSMGGATAVLETSTDDHPYKALVLLAPGTITSQEWIAEVESRMAEAKNNGFYNLEWFGQELHVSQAYYKGLIEAFEVFRNYDNNEMNTILIYGDKDDIVLPEYSAAFADQMDVEAIEIKGANHGYGFYSDEPEVTSKLENSIGSFFEKELLNK